MSNEQKLKFFRAKDDLVQTLGQQPEKQNSFLFSIDNLKMYGNFNKNFKAFGERRDIINENEYQTLSKMEKVKDNRQTYYIMTNDDEEINYEYSNHITVNRGSLIIITDKENNND